MVLPVYLNRGRKIIYRKITPALPRAAMRRALYRKKKHSKNTIKKPILLVIRAQLCYNQTMDNYSGNTAGQKLSHAGANMRVKDIYVVNFRNLSSVNAEFSPFVNVLAGLNAQGKTNLLECVLLALSGKSHRETVNANFVGPLGESAYVRLNALDAQGCETESAAYLANERKMTLNGEAVKSRAQLMQRFSVIFFGPDDLGIVKNGPAARRVFLDESIALLSPAYARSIADYTKVLRQRNTLLKGSFGPSANALLDVYDEQLAALGEKIRAWRIRFLKEFSFYIGENYQIISGAKEDISLAYYADVSCNGMETGAYLKRLLENRRQDISNKTTGFGVHRDDMLINIGGRDARRFASQGQQRSASLCLKLSMLDMVKKIRGCGTVVLLDDVMSELDAQRQRRVTEMLGGMQAFITCVDDAFAAQIKDKKMFHVHNGAVTSD